jgi:aldehyde:ferredoxin oxidoreductase
LFARKVYDRNTILAALNAIGGNYTDEELTEISKRIYKTKMRIKEALGFDVTKVKIAKRFFETPSLRGKLEEETAYHLINKYNEKVKDFMKNEA